MATSSTSTARGSRSQGELFVDAILFPPGLVLWADGSNLKAEDPSTPGAFDAIAQTDSNSISGIALMGSKSYFSEANFTDGSGGVIYGVINSPNQTPVRLARGQNGPRAVAVGATKVYWSTADCTIESTGL